MLVTALSFVATHLIPVALSVDGELMRDFLLLEHPAFVKLPVQNISNTINKYCYVKKRTENYL